MMSTRDVTRALRDESRRFGRRLERVAEADWPPPAEIERRPVEVWRSRHFLLMVWPDGAYERLSVVRIGLAGAGRFLEGIGWDELQRLKAECGRGDRWAVEVYPPDDELVNVQNMRHLFLLPEAPGYGWRRERAPGELGR